MASEDSQIGHGSWRVLSRLTLSGYPTSLVEPPAMNFLAVFVVKVYIYHFIVLKTN